MFSSWRDWIVDRSAWRPVYDTLLRRRVAKGSWYFGDGATLLLLFAVQVGTGAVLMLTYVPGLDAAWASVQYLSHEQTLGWFIRGLHYWSAGLLVLMLFFHLFREILVAGYKSPREITWLLGVLLFVGLLGLSYTGYLLRWDERGLYGLKVGVHLLWRIPLIGDALASLVQGGPDVGPASLSRMYALHVLWLPLAVGLLLGAHLYLVMTISITCPTERERPVHSAEEQRRVYEADAQSETRGEWFYPDTAVKSGVMAGVVFAIALGITLFYGPPPLQPEANLVTPAHPAEEWWFWWFSGLIALLPPAIAPAVQVLLPLVVLLGLLLLPFLDRGPQRGMRRRPIAVTAVVLSVIVLLLLTDYRRRSPFTGGPNPELPPIPATFELTPGAELGRQLFVTYGCNSCHAIGGVGPGVGTDLTTIQDRYSRAELKQYILHPPADVAMPSYEGRMTPDALERVAEFVLVIQTLPRNQ